MHTQIHTCTHMYIYSHMQTHMHAHTYTWIHTNTHTQKHRHIHIQACSHTDTHAHTCSCIHTDILAHMHMHSFPSEGEHHVSLSAPSLPQFLLSQAEARQSLSFKSQVMEGSGNTGFRSEELVPACCSLHCQPQEYSSVTLMGLE